MNNPLLRFSILISLVLVIIVAIYILPKSFGNIDESMCEEITDKKEQGSCFLDFAKIQEDIKLCREIKESSIKGDCYYYFAVKENDIELCDKAKNKEEFCYEALLEELASEDLCKEIRWSYRDECYYNLAVKTNDVSWCDKLYGNEKEGCYSSFYKEETGLTVISASWSPSQPKVGDTLNFFVKIRNSGGRAFPSIEVLVVDQYGWGSRKTIYNLNPGQETQAVVTLYVRETHATKNPHEFRIKVKSSDGFSSDEIKRTINVSRR